MSATWRASLKTIWEFKMIIFFSYLLTFLITTVIAFQIYTIMDNGLNKSNEVFKLIHGFDRTVIEDYMNANKNWKDLLTLPIILCSLSFIFISVFNNAGLIACYKNEEKSIRLFIKNGAKYFFPFLVYAAFFLICILVFGLLIFYIYSKIMSQPIEDYSTEKPMFYSALATIILFVLKAAGIWVWSVNTRYHYVGGFPFFNSILEGLKSTYKSIWQSLIVLAIVLLLFGLSLIIHNILIQYNSSLSYCRIIIVFFSLQLVLLFRYTVRAWTLKILNFS